METNRADFNLHSLVSQVCAELLCWTIISVEEENQVVIVQHTRKLLQLRFRYVLYGEFSGQIKIIGRVCGELEKYNAEFNIDRQGNSRVCIYVVPKSSAHTIGKEIERRLMPKLLDVHSNAHHQYCKDSAREMRILDAEERMITASYNQLVRNPQSKALYFTSKRGRNVEVIPRDPQEHAGHIRILLEVDADEAERILHELFGMWQAYNHPDMTKKSRKS